MKGTRADIRLTELGLAESREKARSMIMEGLVYLREVRIVKPGETVPPDAELMVRGDANPFVSRGGLKLQKAMDKYGLSLENAVALDIGASTGGFTDCMLKHGAKKVYAIDVGYGQLDWRLRNDPRVVVMERTNARGLSPDWFEKAPDFASIDVSFISVRLILPALYVCLRDGGNVIALIKPQFEAGRGCVGKNGVVRDVKVHAAVLAEAASFARSEGFAVRHMDYSPIKGPKGNIEFLLALQKGGSGEACADDPQTVAALAHTELDRTQ